jgi:tetratricopeptide (TPR) repeat protein
MRINPALLSLTILAAATPACAQAPVVTTTGAAHQVMMMQGRITFSIFEAGERFSLDAKQVPSTDDLLTVLDDSDKTGKPVTVHLYPESGRFENGAPTFAVLDIEYGSKTFKIATAAPSAAKTPAGKAAGDLAKGLALLAAEDFAGAHAALDAAVTNGALSAELRLVALKTRADLSRLDAYSNHPPGADRDRLLRAALVDDMAWHALAPDSGNARAAVANAKAALGGYEDAIAEFQAMLDKWPRAKVTTYLQIEAVELTRGNYDKALAALDEVAKTGAQSGMAYHYHRGWVLSELKRDDDAIAEFTAGLKAQPDYAWAYVRRACSYGRTSKIAEAVADQEMAVKLLGQGSAAATEDEKFNQTHSTEILAQLKALKDLHAKTDVACGFYWSGEGVKRERSALLPPEGAPPRR